MNSNFLLIIICGPGDSSIKALSYGLDVPGTISDGVRDGDFSSFLLIQTYPGVH